MIPRPPSRARAMASRASVTLRTADRRLEIEVADDGTGFDPTREGRAGHYGLIGLRERIRQAGGILEIHSGKDNKGTVLTAVVPFPAGGPTDAVARIMAERMRAALGQPIIIENVSGAGGSLGVRRVARAAADGYTLSFSPRQLVGPSFLKA